MGIAPAVRPLLRLGVALVARGLHGGCMVVARGSRSLPVGCPLRRIRARAAGLAEGSDRAGSSRPSESYQAGGGLV